MLEDIRNNYLKYASQVVGWESMNKNDLINKCIDSEKDPVKYNCYFSAVVLRYWGNIGRYYTKSKQSGFSIEDCYEWLLDAIIYILKMRKWRDPKNKLSEDPNAPDKCINRCIYSSRQQRYYTSNLDKHKLNYSSVSLDLINQNVGDHTEAISDKCYTTKEELESFDLKNIFKKYLEKDKILTSLVLYSICEEDCFVQKLDIIENKKVKKYTPEFKLSKLVNCIYKYNEDNVEMIAEELSLNMNQKEKLKVSISNLKKITKNRVTTIIRKTIENLALDKELRGYLCC